MKIVLNRCFGGFSLSDFAVEKLGLTSCYEEVPRNDPKLIKLVEEDAEKVSGMCAKLRVIEFPDNCTDWEIDEYDGYENVTYVIDGKIHHDYQK